MLEAIVCGWAKRSAEEEDNDKNPVIALREIGEGKVTKKTLENAAVNKLRRNPEGSMESDENEEIQLNKDES